MTTTVCIYWDTNTGSCGAGAYYAASTISCYNGGNCDGSGTCISCSKYDVPGLKFWTLDSSLTNTQVPLNLRICNLRAYFRKCCHWSGAPIDLYAGTSSSTFNSVSGPLSINSLSPAANSIISTDFTLSFDVSDVDGNLDVSSASFTVDGVSQTLPENGYVNLTVPMSSKTEGYRAIVSISFPNYKGAGVTRSFSWYYDYKTSNRVQPALNSSTTRCRLSQAADWQKANTENNPHPFPCNGANPTCPYYTGPKWQYCTNESLTTGKGIKASQVMELRYYSRDWWKMSNPRSEWESNFKKPDLWAWDGTFEHGGSVAISENDAPMVKKVSVDSFSSDVMSITVGAKRPADRGVVVNEGTPDYPTLIWDLANTTTGLRILWPTTTRADPLEFKTFRIGQEYVWVIVYAPDEGEVYAVNTTKHSQSNMANQAFLDYMTATYPDDLFSASVSSTNVGVVFIPVKLEHTGAAGGGAINKIRIYFRASGSSVINTEDVFVRHKFYHGMLAQTSGRDLSGIKSYEQVVTTFSNVDMSANIWDLTGNTSVRSIFWDALPAGKFSIYDIEELVQDQTVDTWEALDCRLAALTIDDTRCSHVVPWSVAGTCRGTTLGIRVYRSGNEKVPDAAEKEFDLDLYFKSSDGRYMPGNMLLVTIPSSKTDQPPLDPQYDIIKVTYSVTEYKQAPVASEDIIKLKRPTLRNNYLTELPLNMSYTQSQLSVSGPVIRVVKNSAVSYISNTDLMSFRNKVITALLDNESSAMDSFSNGGITDAQLEKYNDIFARLKREFEASYSGYTFQRDGLAITLERLCDRLENLKYDDGSYVFMAIFNDEDGRPVGIKRAYMMLQSSIAQTRDVEIYYKWKMQRQFWLIVDEYFCLAEMAEPMVPGTPNGVEVLIPKCGDHNHQIGKTTTYSSFTYGDQGPMWYPYNRCLLPSYEQKAPDASIKCENNVEGFAGENYEGKRFAYWERMRGPDVFQTVDLGPIVDLCCCYGRRDGNWQSIGEQKFFGYTKIRSTHPNGPYGKDRECIRVNRHYNKRNLKVRRELTATNDDANIKSISSQFSNILYDSSGDIKTSTTSELPIWAHINDNVSEVSRTTEYAQHPFSHYILSTTCGHSFSETFSSGDRYELKDVVKERDLTQVSSNVYKPKGPSFSMIEGIEEVGDSIWVYKTLGTAWAWLERPKEPLRGSNPVGGIHLYAPVSTVWTTSLKTASHSDEGYYSLLYKAPVFNDDGSISAHPYITLDGGPRVTINWVTGAQTRGLEYDKTTQDLAGGASEPFQLFGLGESAGSFLADNSGLHRYVRGFDGDTILIGRTLSGLAMGTSVYLPSLPYTLKELFTEKPDLWTPIDPKVTGNSISTFDVSIKGYKYVERIEVTYKYNGEYDIPALGIFGYNSSGISSNISSNSAILGSESEALTTRIETYTINSWCSKIRFQYGTIRTGRKSSIEEKSIKIWYREPEDRTEIVFIYDRKVNISTGTLGNKDYRDLLYYYSKAYWDTGSSINDSGALTKVGRNIKDVVIEYEFYDPLGNRFSSYRTAVQPSNITGYLTDADGIPYIEGPITIYTKGRTVLAGTHKTDVMDGYISPDEDVSFSYRVGENKLYEEAQEKLYESAKALVNDNTTTTYEWFWHPDEVSFFEDELGVDSFSDIFSCTLTLKSTVIPMNYIWMDDKFCCSEEKSSPYGDGRIHYINTWRALGHWIYAGDPKYNHPCGVVLSKIGEHIGEKYYGTSEYKSLRFNPEFPWETPRDAEYYLKRGLMRYGGGVYTGNDRTSWAAYQMFGGGV